jgi:hypothetical protein
MDRRQFSADSGRSFVIGQFVASSTAVAYHHGRISGCGITLPARKGRQYGRIDEHGAKPQVVRIATLLPEPTFQIR